MSLALRGTRCSGFSNCSTRVAGKQKNLGSMSGARLTSSIYTWAPVAVHSHVLVFLHGVHIKKVTVRQGDD
jgi:hypothetical protein